MRGSEVAGKVANVRAPPDRHTSQSCACRHDQFGWTQGSGSPPTAEAKGFGPTTPDDPAGVRSELHEKGRTNMASSGKKKATMAKLTRESKLRERRMDKQARKDARRHAIANGLDPYGDTLPDADGESAQPDADGSALEPVGPAIADA